MQSRPNSKFTPEFRADAVRLAPTSGRLLAVVARDLDLSHSALRVWVRQAAIDAGGDWRRPLTKSS